jgi:hypothetical protein
MLPNKTGISGAIDVLKSVMSTKKKDIAEPSFFRSRDSFRKSLEMERLRADRSNSYFTLVILSIPKASLQEEQKKKLYDFLKKEFRVTDTIGWIDDHNLGVILYAADREEAFTFLRRLKERGELPVIADSYTTCFTYPYEKEQIDKEISGKRKSDRIEIQLNAEITLLGQQPGQAMQIKDVTATDISESGVYLETNAPFEEGQQVDVTICLPLTFNLEESACNVEIKASGKIIRKQDKGMAIAFDTCELLPHDKIKRT